MAFSGLGRSALFSAGNRWHQLLSGQQLKGKIIPNLLFRNTLARFEFIVDGPPVSQQARRRALLKAWKVTVRQEAEKYWPSEQKTATGLVILQITYFYDSVKIDVDNIVKPIQDAIIGLAYVDDDQVTDVLARKRNLSSNFKVENMTSTLAEGFSRGNEFLHILVIDAPDQEVLT